VKKALWLSGLFLCVGAVYAADTQTDRASESKKRNEEAYERMLEQTGWTHEATHIQQKSNAQPARDIKTQSSPPKSS
jgi:hypothetical protein